MQLISPIFAAILLPLLIFIAWVTRRPMRGMARWCSRAAAVLLWMALAGLQLRCDRPPVIAVMIDVSPSTRGALLRDPKAVAARVAPLLAGRTARIQYFADGLQDGDAEPRIDRTRLETPDADAILLFSDGRFEAPPSLPPVFPVIDPSLDDPGDGQVISIQTGDKPQVAVALGVTPRTLKATGDTPATFTGLTGDRLITLVAPTKAIRASLVPADRWPENDSLSAKSAPAETEQWAIDSSVPGMRTVPAASLPTSLGDYAGTATIILPAASEISLGNAAMLRQYVETLGGTLIITGPPALAPPALRAIAPLSSDPPQSPQQWMVMLDASGSMAEGGRWPAALTAAEQAVRTLPAGALVSVMTFNRSSHIVVDHQPSAAAAEAIRALATSPPSGPTGLRSALEAVSIKASGETRVLLITDGDAELSDTAALSDRLTAAHVSVFALLTQPASNVQQLAEQTGGKALVQSTPTNWNESLDRLAAVSRTVEIKTSGPILTERDVPGLILHPVRQWQAWAKASATVFGPTDESPALAAWEVGLGRVFSLAADVPAIEISQFAALWRSPSIDPRFSVDFDEQHGHVRIIALDAGRPMNGLKLIFHRGDTVYAFSQTAPGTYEAALESLSEPSVGVIELGGHVIARRAIEGRYPPEFNVIGNDRAALAALAARTGGRVIDVGDNQAIDVPAIYLFRSMQIPAAIAGVILALAALLLLRMPYWEDRIFLSLPLRGRLGGGGERE